MSRASAPPPPPRTLEEAYALILELWRENVKLRARVTELEERVRGNSQNSSRPPSSDPPWVKRPPQKEPSGRKPGGQPGHRGATRTLLPVAQVDEVRDYWPQSCEHCQADLPTEGREEAGEVFRHQVTEVPQVRGRVTEHRLHAQRCPCCRRVTQAPWPAGVPWGSFGPRLTAVVSLLTGCYGLGKRIVVGALHDLFGVELSLGSVTGCEHETSTTLAAPVEEARQFVAAAPAANADETGWWERHNRAWLWLAATPLVAVFLVHARRSGAAARQLLGAFAGVLTTDRWSAYGQWKLAQRQVCWAHAIRDWQFIAECGRAAGRIGRGLVQEAKRMFAYWYRVRDGTMSRETFRRKVTPVRQRIKALLCQGAACRQRKAAGMCREFLALFPALWTFVRVAGVEPTNNLAERLLRFAVLWRKRSFGTHSPEGSRFVERILTAQATLKLQQRNVVDYLTTATAAARLGQPVPSLLPLAA